MFQMIGIFIWLIVMTPALILVSRFRLFFKYFSRLLLMADNGVPTQYDPRAQAMGEIYFDWRCIVCCMVVLPPPPSPGTTASPWD